MNYRSWKAVLLMKEEKLAIIMKFCMMIMMEAGGEHSISMMLMSSKI